MRRLKPDNKNSLYCMKHLNRTQKREIKRFGPKETAKICNKWDKVAMLFFWHQDFVNFFFLSTDTESINFNHHLIKTLSVYPCSGLYMHIEYSVFKKRYKVRIRRSLYETGI